MLIDTHCHFDMMSDPVLYIDKAEKKGDILLGMTNLPSHFQMGFPHIKGYRNIRLALGYHPQIVSTAKNELQLFDQLVDQTSYIGEIGLDFSPNFVSSKSNQLSVLRQILSSLKGKNKIVSVHSRGAEKELLELLTEYEINNVIFHWYSGSIKNIPAILDRGYYFSINEAMILSANGKKTIAAIPKNRILTESDAPFNKKCSMEKVLQYTGMTESEVYSNFRTLLQKIW